MLSSAPAMVSSASPRLKNPFSMVRLAIASLWNSIPGLGGAAQTKDQDGCHCDCAETKKKLDAAVDLVRVQQHLIDSQRAMINDHRKSLLLALETLANVTAARAAEHAPRNRPLDLEI
jgi:hypothetical protein